MASIIGSSNTADYLSHLGSELTFVSKSRPAYRDLKVKLNVGGPPVEVEVRLNGVREAQQGRYVCRGTIMSETGLPQNPRVPDSALEFQRKAPRVPCRLRALSPELPSFKALSVDVSRCGVQLEVEGPLQPNEVISLLLELDLPGQEPVPCRGRVQWCQQNERGYLVGMAFVEMDPAVPQLLDEYALWMAGSGLKPKKCLLGVERKSDAVPEKEAPKPPAGVLSALTVGQDHASIVVSWSEQANPTLAGQSFKLTFDKPAVLRDNRGVEGFAFDDAVEFLSSPLIRAVRMKRPMPLGEPPELYHYQFITRAGEVIFEVVCEKGAEQQSLQRV